MPQHVDPRTHSNTRAKKPGGKERSASTRGTDAEVQAFFDAMARALTAGDGESIADMWETPAFVLGDSMAQVVGSRDELVEFFSGAKAEYNERGVVDTRPEIVRLDWITDRIAIVSVRWPWIDANGRERGNESSTYTLRRDADGALKLRITVFQGASGDAH